MSNKDRIFLGVIHRGQYSLGAANRQALGLARYHWVILITPKTLKDTSSCSIFDVTDASQPLSEGGHTEAGTWVFRSRRSTNPLRLGDFLGAIMVGKLPLGATVETVHKVLKDVAIPRQGQTPEEDCVTWAQWALEALQAAGIAEQLDIDEQFQRVLRLGDCVLEDPSFDLSKRFQNGTKRPM